MNILDGTKFTTIDVETANSDMASICQIGIAQYENGVLTNEWCTYVDPEEYFDFFNTEIHGITKEDVVGAPKLPKIIKKIQALMSNTITVCHTHFDRVSLYQAAEKYNLPALQTTWLDSARVARRTWQECAHKGYGLHNLCTNIINYDFNHHNALEDAKAAAQILLEASKKTGLSPEQWLARVEKPIDPNAKRWRAKIKKEGNPEGELYGEVMVFTGALTTPRPKAAEAASIAGCNVATSVTKKTTMLVVGDQDIKKLAGHKKSTKHRRAEELTSKGQKIRILKESDFYRLIEHTNNFHADDE